MSMIVLASCSSYNRQVADYYSSLQDGNFEKAGKALDQSKLLNRSRNRLLYLLERGKICHLLQQYELSNRFFNEADLLMESSQSSFKDIAFGNLINPMMTTYRGENFEKYLVHYYKALNYLQLHQPEEALVEAKRISLRTYAQEDKAGTSGRYSGDAFSFMIQGMIFEKNDDINNAFIAYRNAAERYLDSKGSYYGTEFPAQLKMDVLRTASINGFKDELQRFEKLFGVSYDHAKSSATGELVIFWENGAAPVKEQQDFYFSLIKGDGGSFFFRDRDGQFDVPFEPGPGYDRDKIRASDLRSIKLSLPRYAPQRLKYTSATALIDGNSFVLEPAESINSLAIATLKERTLKELSTALARVAVKKLAEEAVRPSEESTKDNKKDNAKKKGGREALALGIQLFNFASEKADTRNWQSLPHTIFYTRVPLREGPNIINIRINGQQTKELSYTVNGRHGLQFLHVSTLK